MKSSGTGSIMYANWLRKPSFEYTDQKLYEFYPKVNA
jgi:hypothetical protein